ncbi:alpha-L-fucosidase [Pedobacter gandavensis]|uniref:alpha-L-fucosidase n=1 Tax=Pedobacter gandavensis TaxID=2679963 RepID=UPI002930C1DC|nr:alpha-L-fucosidase [Pedobacter gandavensis]
MMKKLMLTTYVVLLFLSGTFAQSRNQKIPVDPAHRADWFKEARFGMFVHWGLYSILGGEYKGHRLPDKTFKYGDSWYAEWIQQRLEIPEKEYQQLASQFNPIHFNADQWILEAKNAGMKYFVITAKHHDGFALWDSKVSTFDIANSPLKGRDVLGELAKACKKYGLKLGFYYSHWQDWEHPGGDWPEWSKVKRTDADFEKYWQQKSLPQVVELIQRYDPDLLWFDTWDEPNKITEHRRDELIAVVRKWSPKCLINGRIRYQGPGDDIDFLEMHDNQYPDKILERPWQTPATMVHSWGWHSTDYSWKSATEMLGYLVSNTAKGGNYLLNVGPMPDGRIPVAAIHRLREMGGWLVGNGAAVYDTQPLKGITAAPGLVFTEARKKKKGEREVFVSIIKPLTTGELNLPFNQSDLISCSMLETGEPVALGTTNNRLLNLNLNKSQFSMADGIPVIRLRLKTVEDH